MKQSLTLPLALLALVFLGSVAFWVTSVTDNSFIPTPAATITSELLASISATPYTFTRTLKQGDIGEDVRMLQGYLKVWGYLGSTVNGTFAKSTGSAVRKFQTAYNLSRTSVVDAATLPVLNKKVQDMYTTPPPTATISSTPTSISSGSTATISWSSTNATACTLSSGQTGTSGSATVSPIVTTTYTITCTSVTGTGTQSTTVTVLSTEWKTIAQENENFTVPSATLTRYGQGTTWIEKTVTGTATCSNTFYGSDPLMGTAKVCQIPSTSGTTTPPLNGACGSANGTTVSSAPASNLCSSGTASSVTGSGPWTWSCAGSNGGTTASCSASLATVPPPVASLSTSATTITLGQSATLTWSSTNATSCSLSSGQSGTSGNTTVSPTVTTTYTLTCTGSGGTNTKSVTLTVTTTPPPTGEGNWSDPLTWGGTVPTQNQAVTIPLGKTVTLDVVPPRLGSISIEGTLRFARKPLTLTVGGITIGRNGLLEIGTETSPFTDKAVITLDGPNTGASTDRGIVINGGKLSLHGVAPSPVWTKLNDHAEAAATTLTLKDQTNWKQGDAVVVAPTEWPNHVLESQYRVTSPTELRTLTSSNANTVSLTTGLSQYHFGRLQYATDDGMSYTKGTLTKPNVLSVDTLDERAEVGNLTRNIVIQSADDSLWQNNGFGAHIMTMILGAQVKIDGVELTRMGQSGILGRYPIHWHLLSYDQSTGNFLGDAAGNYVKNSAVNNSKHRCIVIHATNGVQVLNNICYNVTGHAFFLEDGSERRNIFEGNLSLKTLNIPAALSTQVHETENGCGGASGFWLTNPDNTVRGNSASNADGNGFWLSYAERPFKQSKLVPISPVSMDHAPFEDNVAHSNGSRGFFLECALTDDLGNLTGSQYRPETPVDLVGMTSYKNGGGGYFNRVKYANYLNWAVADNASGGFAGAIFNGNIMHTLLVGESLNNRIAYSPNNYGWPGPQYGITSYHSTMNNKENIFVNFKNLGYVCSKNCWDANSGALGTNDYYITPVERGLYRSPGNKFINADPGYRALPPHLQPNWTPEAKNNWTLAGAVQDPYGYWSTPGYYSVYDVPFLKMIGCTTIYSKNPAGKTNGLACPGPYYGVYPGVLNAGLQGVTKPYNQTEAMDVTRVTKAGAIVGNWNILDGSDSNFLGGMRHFATAKGSDRYILKYPNFPATSTVKMPPRWVELGLSNFVRDDDSMVLGVHYDGDTVPAMVYVTVNPSYPNFTAAIPDSKMLTAVSSLTEVESGNGLVYYQDKAQNLVWVKIINYKFPLNIYIPDYLDPNSDHQLYRSFTLRIMHNTITR